MSEDQPPSNVPSPCLSICVLDEGLGYCIGCGRTRAEIWKWTRATDDEKREILRWSSLRPLPPREES
jgi:uncharacterized protein